jgi:hypothetical protein
MEKSNPCAMKTKWMLFLIASLCLCGCRDIHCPAFPVGLANMYFPYYEGKTVSFYNSLHDTIVFTIKEKDLSTAYSFAWNCKCVCGSYFVFKTDSENKYNLKIAGDIDASDFRTYLECRFHYGAEFSDDVFIESNINSFSVHNYALFGDTIIMEKENNKRIGTVTIVKGIGIVAFRDNEEDCTWTLIE